MSDRLINIIIGAVLLLHGLGHGGALGALLWIKFKSSVNTGAWSAAHSWALPSLPNNAATTIASVFWILALIGFVAAALSFWGVLVPEGAWRQIAVVSAIISIFGIILFMGIWPTFNTITALGVNIAILVTQIWLHWPPQTMFGKWGTIYSY